jgi:RND family efflux transporter MFP subunit
MERQPLMRYPIIFPFSSTVVLALSLGSAGCARAPSGAPSAAPTPVSVSYPVEREITNYADFTGRLEAVNSVEVRARVTGYLDRVYFTDGAEVVEGSVLCDIDPRSYRAEVARTKSSLVQATARRTRLSNDFHRAEMLIKRESLAKADYDLTASDYAEAGGAEGMAKAQFDLAELNLSYTKVTAPIGGLLSRRLVDPGNLVQADTTMLTTIVSLDPIYLYFDIDERTVMKLRGLIREGKLPSREQGAVVPIQTALAEEEGFPHKGVINFSDNKINPRTGTLRVRGVIENPVIKGKTFRLLSPGLFARVRMPLGESHRALLVSERALDTDQGQKILYVVDDKNKVDSRPVRVGTIYDGLLAIEDGLKPGERVIVLGLQQVRPGAVVEPKLVDMPVSSPKGPGAVGVGVGAGGPGLTGDGLARAER